MTLEKQLRQNYLDAFDKRNQAHSTYTFEQIQALRNMAEKDIYPDGRFSDEECNIWSMFHNMEVKR